MINSAGKFDTRFSANHQDDIDSRCAHRGTTAGHRRGSGNKGTWLKRASGLLTAGFLAADGAQARELLQNCASAQRAVGTSDARWLQSAGPYVNAVASNQSWVPQDAEVCPPPYPVTLSYTFDASTQPVVGNGFGDAGSLDPTTQQVFESDFDDITASVALTFTPYENATTLQPNLVILRSTDANTPIKHWGAEAPGYAGDTTSHAVYTEPNGTASAVERLAGLGFMLGLKAIGSSGTSGFGLPVGNFGDTALSSVTASADNACWPATRLGPLDLAFLAARHGVAPLLPVTDGILLDQTYGTGGLLVAPNGFTVLAATHPGQVTISLVDDGSSATHIGDSVILLAPGSRPLGADASETQGAWLIGNEDANTFVGSDFDDFFSPGANTSVISTGAGSDSILVDDTLAADIYVNGFNPQSDSIWVSPNGANAGEPASQVTVAASELGAVVQTAHGAAVFLLNISTASLRDPATWIFSGAPPALDAFKIDLCQGLADTTAPTPAPMPSISASVPTGGFGPSIAAASPSFSPLAPSPSLSVASAPIGPAFATTPPAAAGAGNNNASSTPQLGHHSTSHGGVIAGSIIGAGAGIAGVGALAWLYARRRRLAANNSQAHNTFRRFVGEQDGIAMTAVGMDTRHA